MGYRNSRRSRKFYWEQISEVRNNLERYVKDGDSNFDRQKYYDICEQLGQEPDPTQMPLEPSDFPEEVQVAFFMFSLLPDHWEGMSGTYMGKYWDGIDYFFKLYDIQEPKVILYIMKLYENEIVKYKYDKAEQQRKREERKRKQPSGGYTHNVKT